MQFSRNDNLYFLVKNTHFCKQDRTGHNLPHTAVWTLGGRSLGTGIPGFRLHGKERRRWKTTLTNTQPTTSQGSSQTTSRNTLREETQSKVSRQQTSTTSWMESMPRIYSLLYDQHRNCGQ